MTEQSQTSIGILTSGGDGPGMNAAVRAIVRTALAQGVQVYAVLDGYLGMCRGEDQIKPLTWGSVGGILHQGGTIIGTARSMEFRTPEGRIKAAENLLANGIDRLIIIGGDGSLTGATIFRKEWPEIVRGLEESGKISAEIAANHPALMVVGLPGSIDNDLFGTDMTIGTDTALTRITEAVDAISSTAASHQRTFVVEVMGRNCGYLALMGALATGADWVLIPESPPDVDNWEHRMSEVLRGGRQAGRRDSIVVVAEGARDKHGNPITSTHVRKALEDHLGEEVRITVLGHVQRGGTPSAFDRNLGTILGHAAVEAILRATPEGKPVLIGMRGNRITESDLDESIHKTQSVAALIDAKEFEGAMDVRGKSFRESFDTLRTMIRALPSPREPGQMQLRLGVMNAGAPAPGMNAAVRAAVRVGLDQGHRLFGVRNGFRGLVNGEIGEMGWMSVNGWAHMGGSELGTNRKVPSGSDFYAIARNLEEHQLDGLLVIGGWTAYEATYRLFSERVNFPVFNMPLVLLPATIDNDLPGSELSIGADTALNNVMEAVDKIKQSAVASRRCFVVEVMGRHCGYLALMSGLATGAERVYLPEEGVRLVDLQADLENLKLGFSHGKRLGLLIRNEAVNQIYTTGFMTALFEEEGGDLFEVRQAILGHLQQGGDPTPFDRIQATRLATKSIGFLITEAKKGSKAAAFIGSEAGKIRFTPLEDMPRMVDPEYQRPKDQWWLDLRPIARVLAQPGPEAKILAE